MRALCVLQVSTRLGLFYIWHRLLSGISQLKKKNRETKNQKFEVRGHIVDRAWKKKKFLVALLDFFRFAKSSFSRTFAREGAINQGKLQERKSIQNTSEKLFERLEKSF